MEHCSRQCIRRTLYAVMVGISPIVLCLLLIAIARLILHRIEMSYYRRQNINERRRSSSIFYQTGRPTLSYTPVSTTELHRIIQGDYHSQQLSESSSSMQNNSPKIQKSRKSSSANALSNLIIRRNAINSAPLTALFAPLSTPALPTFEIINEQSKRRPSVITITRESIETTTLGTINNNNNNHFYDTNDSFDSEQSETELLLTSSTLTTTTTVVVEEYHDFHSVHSIPYSLNVVNLNLENDF